MKQSKQNSCHYTAAASNPNTGLHGHVEDSAWNWRVLQISRTARWIWALHRGRCRIGTVDSPQSPDLTCTGASSRKRLPRPLHCPPHSPKTIAVFVPENEADKGCMQGEERSGRLLQAEAAISPPFFILPHRWWCRYTLHSSAAKSYTSNAWNSIGRSKAVYRYSCYCNALPNAIS